LIDRRAATADRRRRVAGVLFDGLILAACFFAPLIAALDAQVLFLHWEIAHTVEAWLAFLAVAGIAATLRRLISRLRPPRLRVAAFLMLAAPPLMALVATLLRSVPDQRFLIAQAASSPVRLGGVAMLAVSAAIALAFPARTLAVMRVGRVVLAPVLLVTIAALLRTSIDGTSTVTIPSTTTTGSMPSVPAGHVLVLVFDELSVSRVYEGADITDGLPHLARLGATSSHYLNATSPGGMTLEALAGYVALRRFDDIEIEGDHLIERRRDGARAPINLSHGEGLFARARAAGFRTELFGTYLPYCQLLAAQLDRCEDFSFYNASSVDAFFSPLDAISTNLIFLPRQFPTGYFKRAAVAEHQRRLTDRLEALAASDFDPPPTLRFVHYNVPHSPFIFTNGVFDPPRDPLADDEEAYRQQVLYVDRMLGRILQRLDTTGLTSSTTIVVTSDHEWRTYARRTQWPRVPLIVHRPLQTTREIDDRPAEAEAVIGGLLAPPS
jgi:hypothetical protein